MNPKFQKAQDLVKESSLTPLFTTEIKIKRCIGSRKLIAITTELNLQIFSKSGSLKKKLNWLDIENITGGKKGIYFEFENNVFTLTTEDLDSFVNSISDAIRHILIQKELNTIGYFKFKHLDQLPSSYGVHCRFEELVRKNHLNLDSSQLLSMRQFLLFHSTFIELQNQDVLFLFSNIAPLCNFVSGVKISNPISEDTYNLLKELVSDSNSLEHISIDCPATDSFFDFLDEISTSMINSLYFENSSFDQSHLEAIGECLCDNRINSLGFHSSFDASLFPFFCTSLLPTFSESSLISLSLNETKCIDIDSLFLSIPFIRILSLSNCNLNIEEVFNGIIRFQLNKLEMLNVSENYFRYEQHKKQIFPKSLHSLIINDVQFEGNSFNEFLQFFLSNCNKGTSLTLCKANVSNESWENFSSNIGKIKTQNLTSLRWEQNRLSKAFIKFLENQTSLILLSLSGCFSPGSNKYINDLSLYLCNSTLKVFICKGINENFLGKNTIKIINAVNSSSTIMLFDISNNKCGNEIYDSLRNLFNREPKLDIIHFDDSNPENDEKISEFLNEISNYKEKDIISFPINDLQNLVNNNKMDLDQLNELVSKFQIELNDDYIQPFYVFNYEDYDKYPFTFHPDAIAIKNKLYENNEEKDESDIFMIQSNDNDDDSLLTYLTNSSKKSKIFKNLTQSDNSKLINTNEDFQLHDENEKKKKKFQTPQNKKSEAEDNKSNKKTKRKNSEKIKKSKNKMEQINDENQMIQTPTKDKEEKETPKKSKKKKTNSTKSKEKIDNNFELSESNEEEKTLKSNKKKRTHSIRSKENTNDIFVLSESSNDETITDKSKINNETPKSKKKRTHSIRSKGKSNKINKTPEKNKNEMDNETPKSKKKRTHSIRSKDANNEIIKTPEYDKIKINNETQKSQKKRTNSIRSKEKNNKNSKLSENANNKIDDKSNETPKSKKKRTHSMRSKDAKNETMQTPEKNKNETDNETPKSKKKRTRSIRTKKRNNSKTKTPEKNKGENTDKENDKTHKKSSMEINKSTDDESNTKQETPKSKKDATHSISNKDAFNEINKALEKNKKEKENINVSESPKQNQKNKTHSVKQKDITKEISKTTENNKNEIKTDAKNLNKANRKSSNESNDSSTSNEITKQNQKMKTHSINIKAKNETSKGNTHKTNDKINKTLEKSKIVNEETDSDTIDEMPMQNKTKKTHSISAKAKNGTPKSNTHKTNDKINKTLEKSKTVNEETDSDTIDDAPMQNKTKKTHSISAKDNKTRENEIKSNQKTRPIKSNESKIKTSGQNKSNFSPKSQQVFDSIFGNNKNVETYETPIRTKHKNTRKEQYQNDKYIRESGNGSVSPSDGYSSTSSEALQKPFHKNALKTPPKNQSIILNKRKSPFLRRLVNISFSDYDSYYYSDASDIENMSPKVNNKFTEDYDYSSSSDFFIPIAMPPRPTHRPKVK